MGWRLDKGLDSRRKCPVLPLFWMILFLCHPLIADQRTSQARMPWVRQQTVQAHDFLPMPRKILIFYTEDPLRPVAPLQILGPILEYMGYCPEYLAWQGKASLPLKNVANNYAGVIVWSGPPDPQNETLLLWAQQQRRAHIPVVFFNGFGVPWSAPVLTGFGLSRSVLQASDRSLQIVKNDPRFVGYEVAPSVTPYDFDPIHTQNSQIVLQLQNAHHQTEDAMAITPWGGYALSPFVIKFLPDGYALWVMNPFTFLQAALRVHDFPIPDTTTENGRRLMMVHIDGAGFSEPVKWMGGGVVGRELGWRILTTFHFPTTLTGITNTVASYRLNPPEPKGFIARMAPRAPPMTQQHPSITGLGAMGWMQDGHVKVFAPMDMDF